MPISSGIQLGSGLDVARGLVEGQMSVNKFGRNTEIDSGVVADIWDGGHTLASGGTSLIWVSPTQARIHNLVSTSTDDDGDPVGVGAQTVQIWGLVDWDTAESTETVTMDGTTPVPTSNSYVIIHRMKVLNPITGATSVNVGTITATAATDGTITARINAMQGQTQMAIYGVPSIQTAYMGRLYANLNKSTGATTGGCDISLQVATQADQNESIFTVKHTFNVTLTGTSAFSIPYWVPKVIPGTSIIKIQLTSGANDLDVSGGFDLKVVTN